MKHKLHRTRGLGRGGGDTVNGNQESCVGSLGATAVFNEDAEADSSRQTQKKRSLPGDEYEDLYPGDSPSVSQDDSQSKPRRKKQGRMERRRSGRRRGRLADEEEEKDHFSCLSLEVLCRILNYLPLTSVLLLERQCKKLQHAVDMHLRIRKSIDLCQGSLFGWMPHSLSDASLASLLARCQELVHVYGLHPPSLGRRRSRSCSALTVPGVVDALSGCHKLRGVEVSSILLLQAILSYLPHLHILGTFRNRDGGLPFTASNSLTIPSNANITSLYLFGVTIPELPRINSLTHLSLRWVKLTSSHAFGSFAAPILQTFVMAHCEGPDNPLRYVPLFAGLAASRSLSRLELVRVNYLGGLIQHIVEDCWKLQGFRSLQSVTVAACKHALEADIGFLAITAEHRLEELRVQPSLTKDSLFSALSMAGVTFPHFDSISLGYVDSEAHEDSRRQGFNFLGGAEAPESPAMLTDIGMGSVGQCFPTVTRLSVYNCPHLQYPTNWLSAGNPLELFQNLSHLHLHRCHSIRLINFGDFVSLLPSLEILHLEQMFREPPKGCARVGLSAGTGLGVSSALVQNHHAAAAAAANGNPPNNPPNNNNNNNMPNNNNLPNNNNNNAGNNNNNDAANNDNNNAANDIDVDGVVAGEDDAMDHDDENLIVDEDVDDALDESGMVEEEEEEAVNDADDNRGMLLSCDSDTTGDSDFDDIDYDPCQPEIYQSSRETHVSDNDSSQRSQQSQQPGDLKACNSQEGPHCDSVGSSRGRDCFDSDGSTSTNADIASGRRENQREEEKFTGESSGMKKLSSATVEGGHPRKGDCIEGESSDSGNVTSSSGGVRCQSWNEKKDYGDAEVREDEEKGERQMSDGALPVMRCAQFDSGNREGGSQVNSSRNRRPALGCSRPDSKDDADEQEARKGCSRSTVDKLTVNPQPQANPADTSARDNEPCIARETCSNNASSAKTSMRVKTEPDLNTTAAAGCSDSQGKRWRENCGSPSRFQEARPGLSAWMDNRRPSASCSSGRSQEGDRIFPGPPAAASSASWRRESRELDDWEDFDSPSGSKGKSFVGKGKALMGKRQAAVKRSKPAVPGKSEDSSSSGHRDAPDLKTRPADNVGTSEGTSVSRAEGTSHSSDALSSQPGSSGGQTPRSCHASQRGEPTAPVGSDDEESCSESSRNSSAPRTSAGSGTGNRSTPVLDSPGKRCSVSRQMNQTQGSPVAAQNGSSSGSRSKGPRSRASEQASSSARESCSRTLASKPPPRASLCGSSSREALPGRGMPSSSRHFSDCPFVDTSDEDEDEPPRLLIDESWRGSEEEEEEEEEASDKACQAVSEEIREATRRAREQQSQASSSQSSGSSSYRDCLRSASRLRSQQRSQDSASSSAASLPQKPAAKPRGASSKASTTASALPSSSSSAAAAVPSASSSLVGSGGGLGGLRCGPGPSQRFRLSRTSPKRRRRKPKMCDKSTSTSDPVMEDDHVQGLKISSKSLISLTLQMVGITDLVVEDCPRLASINVSACRVLRRVELQDLPVLRRVSFVQCRKLEELQLLAELTDLPECDRLIHLRPMKPVNRDQLEKLLFGTADMECHVCLIYDDCPDPNETLHERTHVSDLLDVFSSLNQHLLEQDRLPYGLGSDSRLLYTMQGEDLDCPSWTVVTDIPWLRLLHASPAFLDRSATGWPCVEVGRTAVEELLRMLGPHIASLEELGLGLFPHCMLVYVSLSDVAGTPQDDYYI